jgi:nicotinamide riboside kinase
MFDIDLPWVPDGTRMFGTDELRTRVYELSKRELEKRNLPWAMIGGHGEERFQNAIRAIGEAARAGCFPEAA